MKFDPLRKYSTVHGIDPAMPGARYEQGPYIYTAHHKCLNPEVDAPVVSTVEQATERMITELTQKLEIATEEYKKAKENFDELNSPANKSKLTKTTNKYESIKLELDGLLA